VEKVFMGRKRRKYKKPRWREVGEVIFSATRSRLSGEDDDKNDGG
jgi:hypothetical protein